MTSAFPVHLFEEHSSSLPIWWHYRDSPLTVVYLDAHLDLQQVDEEKIAALAECNGIHSVRALEAPHHLNPGSQYAYGIENFLYAASRTGLIERLIWVAPPHIPRHYSAAMLDYMQQMDGFSFEQFTSFKPMANALRGNILGLDITICSYQDLGDLDVPTKYALDIDIDYFVKVPEDQLWVHPGEVAKQILDTLGPPQVATISRAVGSGFTPKKFRYIGDLWQAALTDDHSSFDAFCQLSDAVFINQAGEGIEADQILQNIPGNNQVQAAVLQYRSGLESDPELAAALRQQAVDLNPAYQQDLSTDASSFPHRRKKMDFEQLPLLLSRLEQLPKDSNDYQHGATALAQLYAAVGQVGKAWELMQTLTGDLEYHGDILLGIAAALLQSDEADKAPSMLARAAQYDKVRTQATLYLADYAFNKGAAAKALEYYSQIHDWAPAWNLPLDRIKLCHEILNNNEAVEQVTREITRRHEILSELTSP